MMALRGFFLTARHAAVNALWGKRLIAIGLLTVLPVIILALAGAEHGHVAARVMHRITLLFVFLFMLPFSALFLGSAVLGDEIEGRTITYLFTRPVDRGLLFLGRLVGIGFSYSILLTALLAVAFNIWPVEEGGDVFPVARTIALAVGVFWVYLALFAFLRTVLKRSLLIGMGYIAVLDVLVSKMPYMGVVKLSVWHHAAVIYGAPFKAGTPGLRILTTALHPDETAGGSILILAITFVVCAVLGAVATRTREYPVAGAVA